MEFNVKSTPLPESEYRKIIEEYTVIYVDNDFSYEIIIPEGFVYNGASIPRILWSLIGTPYSSKYDTPSCVHDYLYRKSSSNNVKLYQNNIYIKTTTINRALTDKIFYDLLLDNAVGKWMAFRMYAAVRLFGKSSFKSLSNLYITF